MEGRRFFQIEDSSLLFRVVGTTSRAKRIYRITHIRAPVLQTPFQKLVSETHTERKRKSESIDVENERERRVFV